MLYGAFLEPATLELRKDTGGGRRLTGRFPYNKTATLSDGGRTGKPRKERFAPRAFAYRVNQPNEDIHILLAHDYSKPLASKGTTTLSLFDRDDALTFDAAIQPAIAETQYAKDMFALIESGMVVGLSPGFRIPPERAVEDAVEETEEDYEPELGNFGAIIRTVKQALLYELSVVTRPAYVEAYVELRHGQMNNVPSLQRALHRWRV
jgi:hypothetical protein